MANDAKDLLEKLHTEVEALVSGDDWQRMLDLSNQMHTYSFGNLLLIAAQRPGATMVAGYRKWQGLDRQVRRGERSIRILAPIVVKETDEDGTVARKVVGFRGVGVFDIGQTDGPALPCGPSLLDGVGPEGMLASVVALIQSEGFGFERGHCGGANGYTDWTTRTVRVRADVSEAQAVKTAIHELAHIRMHAPADLESFGGYAVCRGRCEVEAESVAYVVAARFGLSTDEYSFAYVAGWSGGDVKKVKATGTAVLRTAGWVIERLSASAEAGAVLMADVAA